MTSARGPIWLYNNPRGRPNGKQDLCLEEEHYEAQSHQVTCCVNQNKHVVQTGAETQPFSFLAPTPLKNCNFNSLDVFFELNT